MLVRFAHDVYVEYEHKDEDWSRQKSVTVNFAQELDLDFQRRLNKRLLASGKLSRDRRLQWLSTPPEQIPRFVQCTTPTIEVPSEVTAAKAMLVALYNSGSDALISSSFAQFAAVLDSVPGGMDLAYMAEVNLGINHFPFDKNRVEQAISVFQEAMERGDVHPDSLLYCMGNARMVLGEYEKARDVYQSALAQFVGPEPDKAAAQCNKNLGSALEKLSESDGARECYERALAIDPDLGEAHLALALLHYREGSNPQLALGHLDRVMPRGGSALQLSVVQGWRITFLFQKGDTQAAYREISNLLGHANQLSWIWPWCARHVAQYGRKSADSAQRALVFWRAYLREHANDSDAEQQRLLCLWTMRSEGIQTEINFEQFELSVMDIIRDRSADAAFLWDRVGHWAQYDGNWVKAESAYRQAYELEPDRYGYCFGTALNFLERYQEALPILLPQAEQHLPDALSWFQIAKAREGVGDPEGSILAYERALKLDPNYDLAWFNLGGIYWNSGNIGRATETWREAAKRFPNHELTRELFSKLPFLLKAKPDA